MITGIWGDTFDRNSQPGHVRHGDVAQDQVRAALLEEPEGILGRGGGQDREPVFAEKLAEGGAHLRLVIDHEDAGPGLRGWCFHSTAILTGDPMICKPRGLAQSSTAGPRIFLCADRHLLRPQARLPRPAGRPGLHPPPRHDGRPGDEVREALDGDLAVARLLAGVLHGEDDLPLRGDPVGQPRARPAPAARRRGRPGHPGEAGRSPCWTPCSRSARRGRRSGRS